MEDNDTQLQLKKRARRRLVGAVAFAGFAAVVLPMIMDQEPQPALQDVEIRIPGQDDKPFAPKFATAPPVAPAPVETPAAPAPPAVVKPAAVPAPEAAKAVEKPAAKPAEKAPEKTPEKTPEKPAKPAETKPAETASKSEAARAAAILAGQAQPPAASAGQFVILIGAFADPANVKNLQSKLGELGIKVFTEPLESPQGRKIRVRAGPFASKDAAEKALEKMKRIGVSGVLAAKP